MTATSGRQALTRIAEATPDLVLLDLSLPDLDGVEVLHEVRRAPATTDLPVVVVTAHTDRRERIRVLEAGADDFLEKPIDPPLLWARVKNCLQMKSFRDELRSSHDELRRINLALEERHALVTQLQNEQEEISEFIVHDLKNPIAAILLNLELLSHARLPDPTLDAAVADSLGSAARLQSMVADLLTLSRLRLSGINLDLQTISIDELMASVVRNYERAARSKKVRLQISTGASVPLRGDPQILTRVLENLLENALRFTPANGVVSVSSQSTTEVIVRVSNSGPSVPESDRARIFQKFVRAQASGDRKMNVGLGLYFCKRALEAHGGRIEVLETPEFPTSFVLHLPRTHNPV